MATPRDIRRLALLALYQIDARGEPDLETIRDSLADALDVEDDVDGGRFIGEAVRFSDREYEKAFALASEAWEARRDADRAVAEAAPTWPAHRQAPIDRAILRLGYYELTLRAAPAPVVINETVELAKVFSAEKSPRFINGVLDTLARAIAGQSA
ncbi:MAG: transcription antitermination factor NusB [Phycisphaerae bacterium]|nr:transcription antitermination factor NusB [Phycisphaerae bacterium]